MAAAQFDQSIQSVEDLLSLVHPGECLLLSLPDVETVSHVRRGIDRTAPPGTPIPLIALHEYSPDRPAPKRRSLLMLKPRSTAARAASGVRRFLKGVPPRSGVIVDAAGSTGGARTASRILPLLAARDLRVLLLICRNDVSDKERADLKDAVDFFLDVRMAGLLYHAQFLSARRTASPDFFLPLRLTVNDAAFRMELPGAVRDRPPAGDAPASPDGIDQAYREIFECAPEAIVLFGIRIVRREANRRACELLGMTRDQLADLPLREILPPEALRVALRPLVALGEKGRATAEVVLKRKNGKTVVLAVAASRLAGDRYMAMLRDVTAARGRESAAHEAGEWYRSIMALSPLPQCIVARKSVIEANDSFRRAFPRLHVGPDHASTLADMLGASNTPLVKELSALGSNDVHGELRRDVSIARPDGEPKTYDLTARSILRGEKALLHLTLADITLRTKEVAALQESERRYRSLMEAGAGAVTLLRDGSYRFVTAGFARLFGYARAEELEGRDCTICVAPKSRKAFLEHLGAAGGRFEYTGLRNDGSSICMEGEVDRVFLGEEEFVLVTHRDASGARAQAEDVKRRAKDVSLLEQIDEAFRGTLDYSTIVAAGLQASLKALGFESGGFLDLDASGSLALSAQSNLPETIVQAFSLQSTREGVTGLAAKTLEPLILATDDYPPHLPYKSLFESAGMRLAAFIPLVSHGELCGMVMACTAKGHDGETVQRSTLDRLSLHFGSALANAKTHAKLRSAEELHRSVLEGGTDVAYKASADGSYLFLSPQVERLTGHAPHEFMESPDLWRSLLHPADRSILSQRIALQAGTESQAVLEYRLLPRRTAAYRWVRDSFRYARDASGKVESLVGTLSDITPRMESERGMRESEELRNNVMESVHEGVVVYDGDFRCIAWNRAMETMTGIRREEMIGKGVVDPDREGSGNLRQLLGRALLGETVNSEHVADAFPLSDGHRILWGRFSPLRDKEAKTIGVVGTVSDVTHRRVLERDVQESEETLKNVIDAMGDALMITDLQGKVWEVNREFSLLTGYPRSEVLGLTFPYPWLVDEEMGKFVTWIGALREKRYLRDFDMTWRAKDGRSFAISLNTTLLRNALGEPVAMLNLARNITERRQLANELAVKNKQIEILNRIISKANASIEFSKIFDSMAIEVYNLLKYDQINVGLLTEDREHQILFACVSQSVDSPDVGAVLPLERTVSRLAIDRGHAVIVGNLAAHKEISPDVYVVAEGLKSQISIPIMLNKAILGTFNIASLQEDAFTGKELAFLQPIADQIGATIDRTQLFQRVSNDSKYIHNLLNSLDNVVYTVDRNLRIREVNKAWSEFAVIQGTPRYADEAGVVGQKLSDVINIPSLLEDFSKVMPRLFEGTMDSFSRECEAGAGAQRRIYQVVVSPMVIDSRVVALVFTNTDITESKRAEAEVRSRNKELVALNALSTSITKSLNLEEILNVASEQTAEIVGADVILCHLIDASRNQLVLSRHRGVEGAMIGGIAVLDIDNSATGTAIKEQRPLFINKGLGDDPRVNPGAREVFRQLEMQSMAVFPLRSKDKVLGSLAVVFKQEHEFTAQEQRFLTLIGNQLGSAIENAQLYAEVQSQVERVTSLYELGKGLAGALDTRRLFEAVYAEAVKSLPIDHFAYDAYAESSDSVSRIFEVSQGTLWHAKQGARPADASGRTEALVVQVAKERKPVCAVVQGDSVMIVPVKSKDHVIGILSVEKKGMQAYGEPHLRILESIANLTAIAVDRAMLFEDTLVKSSEIEQRNRELDDFTYVVSHDLKEPLITIEGYSKIVMNDYRAALDADGGGYLSSIVQAATRMKGLIDDLLTLSRLGRVLDMQQTLRVSAVLNDVLNDFEFTLREKQATVNIPPQLPEVRYNATQLSMVFRNLIANAIKFNQSPEPRVDIGVSEDEKEFTFSIADNGIGIERQHFDRIFVVFQRLHRSEEYRGTGAGLTIVKKIVENHHGRIWVESEVGKGTTFYFTVPK